MNNKLKRIIKVFKNPLWIVIALNDKGLHILNDEKYLKLRYKLQFNKNLDLNNVKTFNEKLQWLKLYDRNSDYTKMVDKYEVKKYIADLIGNEYVIRTIGIYNKFDEINFDELPKSFVVKTTHYGGGAGVFIVKDKSQIKKTEMKKTLNRLLKRNLYYYGREWPYKNVKPKILVEEYMKDNEQEDLKDYKLFCFNGKVQTILVCSDRNGAFKNTNFYDTNWNLMPFTRERHNNSKNKIEKPQKLIEMIDIAQKLSASMPFVRVDLYEINGKVYFGELTLYPSSGFEGFRPKEYDEILGEMLKLPE